MNVNACKSHDVNSHLWRFQLHTQGCLWLSTHRGETTALPGRRPQPAEARKGPAHLPGCGWWRWGPFGWQPPHRPPGLQQVSAELTHSGHVRFICREGSDPRRLLKGHLLQLARGSGRGQMTAVRAHCGDSDRGPREAQVG